ncbi:type I-E CRISPR-associated protein Cas6/Cse3/CasE [Thermoactinospora rubra]|uniref:type I-E CRISPR-associated protein Cas6/Cse3/CasE n=1 Tax=Thermoactinospora rubra TaxID=1088767 RepID=UPI000A117890|nr:type I-E CRISPR-associated protein Cas6/Cse3/CasE [Thermoactinospora rubra]
MTAWLIRILPDTRRRDVQKDLADADLLHKRMMLLVPDDLGGQARSRAGVLFRVEEGRTGLQLLVQTTVPPQVDRLPTGYGEAAVRELSGLLAALQAGDVVRYRIDANPTKRNNQTRKIEALHGAAAETWWAARAAAHGLAVLTSTSQPRQDIRVKGGRHVVVRFDGLATVTDPKLVTEAVLEGIGRAKSYGCGLLSLARVAR